MTTIFRTLTFISLITLGVLVASGMTPARVAQAQDDTAAVATSGAETAATAPDEALDLNALTGSEEPENASDTEAADTAEPDGDSLLAAMMPNLTDQAPGPLVPVRLSDELGGVTIYARVVGGWLFSGDMGLGPATGTWTIVNAQGQEVGTVDAATALATAAAAPAADSATDTASSFTLAFNAFVPDGVAVKSSASRWPSGRVPYVISSSYSAAMKSTIKQAIDHWNGRTPVRLVAATSSDKKGSYVEFAYSPGACCWSDTIGRKGGEDGKRGKQQIFVDTAGKGTIIHEIGHALGFFHEQQRSDRLDYITILWEKIFSGKEDQYWPATGAVDLGPYDYESVMHYSAYEWSFEPSIIRNDGLPLRTQRESLSGGDIYATMKLYPGEAKYGSTIVNYGNAKCVDVAYSGTTDGTNIQLWGCNKTSAQRFVLREIAFNRGVYEIINSHSGMCLDVAFSGTEDGTNIHQWTCNNTDAQRFKLVPIWSGVYELRSVISDKCVDVAYNGSADGTNIQLWSCNGTSAQRFFVSLAAVGP